MKMTILACAVLASSAVCASAHAGAIDAGGATVPEPGRAGAAKLPSDAPAIFMLETVDEAAARQQAEAAALTVGRQYNLDFQALNDVGDPFHGGMAGNAIGAAGATLQADDSVSYQGRHNNFMAGSSWGKGDIDGSPSGRAWGMTVGVSAGLFTLRAAHQNRNVAKITRYNQTGITMAAKNSIIAANLRLGWGTAYAAYSANRGWGSSPLFNPDNPYGAGVISTTQSTNSRDVLGGVAVPLGRATTLLASFIRKNDREVANRDARQIAIGATYAVSRRMDFYAAYSHIRQTNGFPNTGMRPGGSGAINVGMRRGF
ncbi:porin [Massilia sp. H6]|uniref:porin n=1 Tax=Massilia sp. H6 TaxID=2970464 RepID=UPI00216794CF|nr:porin [Massilia sp. H6]UVW30121.1 porin [Massilia sp. H6]